MQWGGETKNRALEPAYFRKEIIANQSQRKAKSQYGICAGFWFDRRGHKAKRSDARFIGASLSEPHSYVLTRTFAIRDIYIYIYIYI